jgi:hypothetical protein
MGDKSISGKINWGRQSAIGKVIGVERGDEDEVHIKFDNFGRSARWMCQQLSPTRKGHHGSRSAE